MLVVIEEDSILGLMQGFLQQEPPRVVGRHRNHNNITENSFLQKETTEEIKESMKVFKRQKSRSWVRTANMGGNATLRRGRRGTHPRNTYVPSLPYVHIGGLTFTLKQVVRGGGLLNAQKSFLPSALEAVTYISAPCECPNRAGCVLNRAGAKPVRHHDLFRGLWTVGLADGII